MPQVYIALQGETVAHFRDGHSGSVKLQVSVSSPFCRGVLELPEILRASVMSPLPDAVIGAADQGVVSWLFEERQGEQAGFARMTRATWPPTAVTASPPHI